MMEEKQAGQFPKSKGPKKLQERDHFAKVWAAALHCLGTHFTKTLSETDENNLNSEHKDQNLQGGVMLISFQLVINLDYYSLNHSDTPKIKTKALNGHVSIASVANKSVSKPF